MSRDLALRRGRRGPRAAVMVPLLSLIILVLGWSVLWGLARQQAGAAIDDVLAREAAHGRRWSCPDRLIDGYPFRIDVTCRDLAFSGLVDGSQGEGHLARLEARAWLYEPSAVYVVLDGPLSLTTADGRGDVVLAWERFGAKLRGLFAERRRAEIVGEGFALTRPNGVSGTARRLEIHVGPALAPAAGTPAAGTPAAGTPAAGGAAGADAESVEIALSAASAPGLDAVTGDAAPLDGLFSGVVTRAFGDLPDLGPATVERWRAAGGRLDVSNVTLTKGPLSLGASGALGLDAQHRVQGKLDARLGGFEPLAKRFGVSLQAVQVGGLLASLLGTKPPPAAAAPGTVALPVVFADGTVAVGPFKTGLRLPPLY